VFEWDVTFANSIDTEELIEYLHTIDFLDDGSSVLLTSLADLLCAKLAIIMKGFSKQELEYLFEV